MQTKGLAEFLAVAESGSFTGAAKALGLSIPHVSRTVKSLEDELGVQLFQRTTRSVQLTAAGELLHFDCRKVSTDLEQALDRVRMGDQAISGRIRLACLTGSFADHVVAPALASFAASHPLVELESDFDTRRVDLVAGGYDAAIRAGDVQEHRSQVTQLSSRRRMAAASPDYLQRVGEPMHPTELVKHDCIRTFSNTWTFSDQKRKRNIEVRGRMRSNSGPAIRAACERGLGIAYMAEQGYGRAFETGSLVPILEPYWYADAEISVVVPSSDFVPARVRALIDHLQEACRQTDVRI